MKYQLNAPEELSAQNWEVRNGKSNAPSGVVDPLLK
jgi:hypothetical protein